MLLLVAYCVGTVKGQYVFHACNKRDDSYMCMPYNVSMLPVIVCMLCQYDEVPVFFLYVIEIIIIVCMIVYSKLLLSRMHA